MSEVLVTVPAPYSITLAVPGSVTINGEYAIGPTGPQGPAGADGADGADGVGFTAGDLPVRNDATQPTRNCLWVAPTGQIVLITGY